MDGGHEDPAVTSPPDSLVVQAACKSLPAHQYMDAATVAWIASHRDEIPAPPRAPLPRLRPVVRQVVEATPVPVSWHAESRVVDSIHGTRHLVRTAALAALLAEFYGLDQQDTATLVVAAAVHDCRRVHDKDDPGHGERGAAWLAEHAAEVFGLFGVDHSPDRVLRAAVAVRLHEVPYDAFGERDTTEHAAAEQVTDVLKTADALDRYRLPKQKWWPNDQFLRALPPPWLHSVAFELVVETETARLDGADSAEAVRTALGGRGLL